MGFSAGTVQAENDKGREKRREVMVGDEKEIVDRSVAKARKSGSVCPRVDQASENPKVVSSRNVRASSVGLEKRKI